MQDAIYVFKILAIIYLNFFDTSITIFFSVAKSIVKKLSYFD